MENILSNATTFKNNNIQKKQILENVTDILKKIQVDLTTAHYEGGAKCVISEIPTVFEISNMSNKDAQRIIWSRVITELKNKNYTVHYDHNKDMCKLRISWFNAVDLDEIDHQYQILKECRQKF